MLEIERVIDPPDVAFARAKDIFGFRNYEEYPHVSIGSVIRTKEFWDFKVEGELWGEIGDRMELRIILRDKTDPSLSFTIEPTRGVTELKVNYPIAVEVEEYSFPFEVPPVEVDEETGKKLAGVLIDWVEKSLRTKKIDSLDPMTPSVSVGNIEVG